MNMAPIAPELLAVNPQINPFSSANTQQTAATDFAALLNDAVNQVNRLQNNASELATAFELGDSEVTLSEVMIARNKASVAFEASLQIRNKFIEAYKELMNMSV